MTLNCRQGDLAIIVRSESGNDGRLVRVLGPSPGNHLPSGGRYEVDGNFWRRSSDLTFMWVVEAVGGPLSMGYTVRPFNDWRLRPIRNPGEDAQDESRAWLPPVPTQHKETA